MRKNDKISLFKRGYQQQNVKNVDNSMGFQQKTGNI